MVMRMLESAGLETYFDRGHLNGTNLNHILREHHNVRLLRIPGTDRAWLNECYGKAIKILDPLDAIIPTGHIYKFIWCNRDFGEMAASQRKFMREFKGNLNPPIKSSLKKFNKNVYKLCIQMLKQYPDSSLTEIRYESVLKQPIKEAEKLRDFLGLNLDIEKMASVVIGRSPRSFAGFMEREIYD